jgi:glycosyltransferase involved in cell wall biosynthesis
MSIVEMSQACHPTYRVAFVNTHPIQYFAPLYAYLTKHCGIQTTGLYLSDFSLRGGQDPGFRQAVTWDVDLLAGYEAKFLGGQKASRRRIGSFFSMVAPELWGEIRNGRYDAVVIHGHNLAAHHVALTACLSCGTPAFTRGDTNPRIKRRKWRETIRKQIMKLHYHQLDGFLAIGSANARYYRSMGIPDGRIFSMPFAVDNDRFIAASQVAKGNRSAIRAKFGIKEDLPCILFASKFDRRKRPDDLLDAYSALRSEGLAAQLVFVGTGVLENELKQRVQDYGIPDVAFLGFVNQAELPTVYAASDVFVLPSSDEPWGLVVNEAMCAGLPIVLSSEIGCVDDLVKDGINGAVFEAGDVQGLIRALRPILTEPDLRVSQGRASLDRIRSWSYTECGAGLREAIETVRTARRSQ